MAAEFSASGCALPAVRVLSIDAGVDAERAGKSARKSPGRLVKGPTHGPVQCLQNSRRTHLSRVPCGPPAQLEGRPWSRHSCFLTDAQFKERRGVDSAQQSPQVRRKMAPNLSK
eukprot:scaffold1136_cov260-Pinguiococcus_pyrenoidosus.AAC.15